MVKLRFRYPQSGTSTLAPGSRSCLNPQPHPTCYWLKVKTKRGKRATIESLSPTRGRLSNLAVQIPLTRQRTLSSHQSLKTNLIEFELARQYLPLLELLNKREGEPSSCQCRRLCLAVTRYGRLKLGAHRRSKLEGQNPVGILQLRGRSERFCGSSGLAAR